MCFLCLDRIQETKMQRRQFGAFAALALSGGLGPAVGQTQPGRIVIGFPPGGSVDLVARLLEEQWRKREMQFVVDNRSGAGGRLAVESVKAAPPDGQTVLLTPASMMAIYPHTFKNLRYTPSADFLPVSRVVSYDFAIAVGPSAGGAKTLEEFIAWARQNPTKAAFASPAAGSAPHFLGAMFAEVAKAPLLHVPYRGTAPAITDVVGGSIPSVFSVFGDLMPQHKAGKLRILAMTGSKRSELLPDVPTFAELGFQSLTFSEWYGLFAPAGTPATRIGELQKATADALNAPTVSAKLTELAFQPSPSTPDELRRQLASDYAYWGEYVRKTGFVAE
jgi:tripartite-type tricarboxylate transporter receptor subunit TctC